MTNKEETRSKLLAMLDSNELILFAMSVDKEGKSVRWLKSVDADANLQIDALRELTKMITGLVDSSVASIGRRIDYLENTVIENEKKMKDILDQK
jgi:hypothetical protein